jgi:hypothetical protein
MVICEFRGCISVAMVNLTIQRRTIIIVRSFLCETHAIKIFLHTFQDTGSDAERLLDMVRSGNYSGVYGFLARNNAMGEVNISWVHTVFSPKLNTNVQMPNPFTPDPNVHNCAFCNHDKSRHRIGGICTDCLLYCTRFRDYKQTSRWTGPDSSQWFRELR